MSTVKKEDHPVDSSRERTLPGPNLSVQILDSYFENRNEDANNFINIGPPQQALSNKHRTISFSNQTVSPTFTTTPEASMDQPTPLPPSGLAESPYPCASGIDSWGKCLSQMENTLKLDISMFQVIGHE